MPRKTVEVSKVRELANSMLLNSEDDAKEGRDAIMTMVERILLDAGQYSGYKYLSPEDMLKSENGTSYGINPWPDGVKPENWNTFEGTDHTRVKYFG